MIQKNIKKLVQYGLKTGLIEEADKIYTTNRLSYLSANFAITSLGLGTSILIIFVSNRSRYTMLFSVMILLCMENEGYAGRVNHPARQNHRVIPVTIHGSRWGFQYSPYVYYNEHCIVFNSRHIPMKIEHDTFCKLFDFVKQFQADALPS